MSDRSIKAQKLLSKPFTEDSLSAYDQTEIVAAISLLPGKWLAQFDKGPNGESYAWLSLLGSDPRTQAFLLRRRHGFVVLTDRISDPAQDQVSQHRSMTRAMRVMFATVLTSFAASRQDRPR